FVKVLDFGLVRYQGGRSRDQTVLTNAGVITGTPTFAAPEIAMEEESVDGRADIYSLGCVAYWLLTGKFVFEGISAMELFLHHIQTPPVPPSERIEAPISPELEAIVMACLKKDPSKRPSSARELLRLLDDCRCLEPWSRERAERWWKEHDPLAGLGFHDSELAEGSPL